MLSSFEKLLKSSQSIVLASHENPDPDAIGSILAFYHYLLNKNKQVIAFAPEPIPRHSRFLPLSEEITSELPGNNFDLLIALDAGNLARTKLSAKNIKFKNIINIDHHAQTVDKKHLNMIQTKAAATTEIIYGLLNHLKFPINRDVATCLLYGIVSDTAHFQHANTTAKTLHIASELMKTGVSLQKISRQEKQTQSADVLRIWGKTIERARVNEKGVLKSVITAQELNRIKDLTEDLGGLASALNTASGIRYTALFVDQGNQSIKVSLRSEKGRGIDVAKIARNYGGGGHKYAAGFTIKGSLVRTTSGWRIINS